MFPNPDELQVGMSRNLIKRCPVFPGHSRRRVDISTDLDICVKYPVVQWPSNCSINCQYFSSLGVYKKSMLPGTSIGSLSTDVFSYFRQISQDLSMENHSNIPNFKNFECREIAVCVFIGLYSYIEI